VDFRQLLAHPTIRQEFIGRFGELAASLHNGAGGLEGLDGGLTTADAERAAESMQEGRWDSQHPGLEAIIQRFARPVYLVQDGIANPPPDGFPDSQEVDDLVRSHQAALSAAIVSTGRIDLRNHRLDWVGTGWLVAPGTVVTNRHVAEEFSRADTGGFAFRRTFGGRAVSATLDWRCEHDRTGESRFRVSEVLWIEPEGADVAFLRIAEAGELGETPPPVVELMSRAELDLVGPGAWLAVVGHPGHDIRADAVDQLRIFDGLYDVKRLAPGQVTGVLGDELLFHDATTLGGNSGSVVADVVTGKAIGLHFGGIASDRNIAVQAPHVAAVLYDRLGIVAAPR